MTHLPRTIGAPSKAGRSPGHITPPVIALAVSGALLTPSPFLGLYGIASLMLIYRLFWMRRQPAIIFWALLHQWLQVNAPLLHAAFLGEDLSGVFRWGAHADDAYILGMTGLLAFAFGLWVVTRRLHSQSLTGSLDRLDPGRCLQVYLAFIALYALASIVRLPGMGQALVALGFLKWGFFYIFFSAVLHTGRYRGALALTIVLEFLFSLFSIFAAFKAILIMPLILLPIFFTNRPRVGQILVLVALATVLVSVGLVWTAVKMDYRAYLAAGARGQVINVSRGDAMNELAGLVVALDAAKLQAAVNDMAKRISYLDFLSGVMGNVPMSLPHENGQVAKAAITHVLTPRMFFPEKQALHDSLHLNKYIGEYVADYSTTSMSIGYVGDLYLDFGWYAPIAVFLLGLLLGAQYRFLYRLGGSPGWAMFLVMPTFFFLYLFEISLIKQIGLATTYTLVMILVAKFALPTIKRTVEHRPHAVVPMARQSSPYA